MNISEKIDLSWCDYFAQFGPEGTREFYNGLEMLSYFSGFPHPFFNPIMRAQFNGEDLDGQILRVLEHARDLGLSITWWVGPLSRPADLAQRLIRHGLVLDDHETGMALELDRLGNYESPHPDLTIEPVLNPLDLEEYLQVFGSSFEITPDMIAFFRQRFLRLGLNPDLPMHHFLARLNGIPVGCSALLFSHGVAGIYNVGTLPSVRRQGIGSAMTGFLLQKSRTAGYNFAVLQASDMGLSVYQRLGFKEYCHFDAYITVQ